MIFNPLLQELKLFPHFPNDVYILLEVLAYFLKHYFRNLLYLASSQFYFHLLIVNSENSLPIKFRHLLL